MPTQNITLHQYGEREIYDEAIKKLSLVMTGAFNQKKGVLIFLSGGSSVNLYAKLAEWIASKKDIEGNLAFAQVDERFQPGDQVSGIRYQASGGKKNNNINADVIGESGMWDMCKKLRIPFHLVSQKGSLEEAADRYNNIISSLFEKYDYQIAILGIGEDGHTAGLIPGYEKDWNIDRYVVGYNLGQNNARALVCQQKFRQRITVTPKLLKKLDYALIVAGGEKKRYAIERLRKNEEETDLDKFPAAIIQNIREVDLYTD